MAPIDLDRESRTRREAPDFYRSYLNSPTWRTKRNAALKRANYRCSRCGSKRDPNVHHKTYERLGNELDSDLEVLCFTCHNGHHLSESYAEPSRIYVRIVSEIVANNPLAQIADIAADAKTMCVQLKVKIDVPLIDKAISLVCSTRLRDGKAAYQSPITNSYEQADAPLTHAQAVEMLARLRTMLRSTAPLVKPMPRVRLVTQGQADQLKAFAMVTREIEASIARCEDLEQQV